MPREPRFFGMEQPESLALFKISAHENIDFSAILCIIIVKDGCMGKSAYA